MNTTIWIRKKYGQFSIPATRKNRKLKSLVVNGQQEMYKF